MKDFINKFHLLCLQSTLGVHKKVKVAKRAQVEKNLTAPSEYN